MSDVEQTAQIRGSGNRVIQAGRDVNLAAEPKLHLTNYETRRGRIESDADRLTAYARAIDMIGRDPELASLWAWLGSARPIALRVLTGPAGTGKTREALDALGAEPGDGDLQAALRVQLKKAVHEDAALREELAAIMAEAVQAGWRVTQTATVTGDGNVVIQAGRDVKQ